MRIPREDSVRNAFFHGKIESETQLADLWSIKNDDRSKQTNPGSKILLMNSTADIHFLDPKRLLWTPKSATNSRLKEASNNY